MTNKPERQPPEHPVESPNKQTGIGTIADVAMLSTVWKKHIRPGLRTARLRDFYLTPDPVQFAAYEWGLSTLLEGLAADLRAATYSPEPATIIRGAKSRGLSRPLAVLSPRDALVFKTLMVRAEPDLKRDLRSWTGSTLEDAGRLMKLLESKTLATDEQAEDEADRAPAPPPTSAKPPKEGNTGDAQPYVPPRPIPLDETESYDDDWFKVWLRGQGVIANICEQRPYIVESDVANFFTSIDLEVVREHLHSHTSLDKEVVRLCISLVRRTLPHPGYADSPTMGLPQEGFDSSRAVAHSLLVDVDRLFDDEGEALLYTRFMDDFVIGAKSVEHGHRLISRLQRGLEPLGLYPNTAKTRVVTSDEYLVAMMADENAWLEEFEARVDSLESGKLRIVDPPAELVDELAARFRSHRERTPKPRRWDRVLRRFYTVLRRVGDGRHLHEALDDLEALPDSATQLLEYIRAFPLTESVVTRLHDIAAESAELYGNVPLLILETLASAPNALQPTENHAAASRASQFVVTCLDDPWPEKRLLCDRMAAATIPFIWKFGSSGLHNQVCRMVIDRCDTKSHTRIQNGVLACALGQEDRRLMSESLPGLPWNDVLALRYLDALNSGDDRAIGVAINLLQPHVKLLPNRYHVHSRPLMLLPILARTSDGRAEAGSSKALELLERNPLRLKDARAEALFRDYAA